MEDKIKEIYEKATDIFFGITKKMDDLSENIFEQTGKKINIKMIVFGVIFIIFITVFVKAILGFVWGFLTGV